MSITDTVTPAVTIRNENVTVKTVKKFGLCTGCGTCAGICPSDAIEIERNSLGIYLPSVSDEKCEKCGICLKVCPGYSTDSNTLNNFVFRTTPEDYLLGNHINCYVGHCTNEKIRSSASSGGIVTSLLLLGLEKKIIDGALVTRMRQDIPLEPEAFLARTEEEIVAMRGSKYCPASVNVAIKNMLDSKGKYAVVGLPCHIHGTRKVEMLNKELKEKIALHIGLFCSHTVNFLGTELLLERIGILKENVIGVEYRGKGWPGKMSIRLSNGCERTIPYKRYWDCIFGAFFFTPFRCTLCADATNELSDISVGDAWLRAFKGDHAGESVIVTRTEAGERFLRLAKLNGKIEFRNIDHNVVRLSQLPNLNFKKKALGARINFLHSIGKTVPYINPRPSTEGRKCARAYLHTILVYSNMFLSSKKHIRSLLKYMPFPILRMYFRFGCALCMLV